MNDTQIETLNWYKQNSSKFKNIEFKRTLKDGTLKIVTKTHIYIMGKKGGLINTEIR